ncbi:MAG: hypothetical protein RL336_1465 [Pseudomonadota bacterium]
MSGLSRQSQCGIATLVFSVIVLLLVTFASLYTAKSVITETKITNNETRSRHAFEAAESGINETFSLLKAKNRPCKSGGVFGGSVGNSNFYVVKDSVVSAIASSSWATQTGHSGFVEVSVKDYACDGVIQTSPTMVIEAVGWSDDKTASRTISVLADQADAMRNTPENPLTARGVVGLTGNVRVYNQEGATTVWSGSGVNVNAASKNYTFIASPSDPSYPTCMYTSATCDVVAVTADGTGVDIIANDTTLSNLSVSEFFENFFGMSMADYLSSGAVNYPMNYDDAFDPADLGNQVVWVDVPAGEQFKIPAVTALGCSDTTALGTGMDPYFLDGTTHCDNAAVGGELEPVILIVNGDLNLPANAHVYGLVVVLGDLISAGNPEITGALVAYGSVGENGAVIVRYNSKVLAMTDSNPDFYVAPGGWRDF